MESIEELGRRWRAIYTVLAAGPRRQIIGSLLEAPGDRRLSLPEAANLPDYRIDPELLHANLVHNHLPIMAEPGFVEWERDPFTVWRGPNFGDVAAVIQAIDTYEGMPSHLTQGCHFHERNGVSD